MAQAATLQEIKDLFTGAGLDYNQVRARGFDNWQMAEIQKGLEAGIEVTGYLDPEMPWTEMEEYRMELEQGVDLSVYRNQGFSNDRLAQIRQGLAEGVDVSVYALKDYFAEQMKEIREGLAAGLPVMFYQDPTFNYMQMAEIKEGLRQNIDISKYADSTIPYRKMRSIRETMARGVYLDDDVLKKYDADVITQLAQSKLDGVDIAPYAKEGYDAEQLEEIRLALVGRLNDFTKYINKQYRGESLKEIRLGLENGVDVSHYAQLDYGWEQMREIRLGLEARVDTTVYEKPLYRAQQMREIRKGLEEGLDVSYYTSMVYSSKEMRLRRRAIESVAKAKGAAAQVKEALDGVGQGINTSTVKMTDTMTDEQKAKSGIPFVSVSDNGLEAEVYIPFKVGQPEYTVEQVTDLLKSEQIIYGVDYSAIADLVEKKLYNRRVHVASGTPAKVGKNGWYDFSFDVNVPSQPMALPDKSVNYEDVKYFEVINAGQKIAEYHDAEYGTDGRDVRGEKIAAIKGRELPILKGIGIMMMQDKKSWCATVSGEIRLNDYEISVRPMVSIESAKDPNGAYEYPGSVQVNGNVTTNVTLKAQGDIVIRGKVDGARLKAGGNIILIGGCIGTAERTILDAGGRIAASTLSNADIKAGANVTANHILDCDIVTNGRVNVTGQRGSIAGGEIQAQMGISCAVLGNTTGKRTIIQLGTTGELTARYQSCLKNISRVEAELTLLRNERERLNGLANNAAKTQNQIKVGQALTIKETEENDLNEERDELERHMKEVTGAKARITHIAHAGVIIIIDGNAKQLNEDVTSPQGVLFRNGGGRVSQARNTAEEVLGNKNDWDEEE